jgi:hypothetical protein
VQRNKQPNFTTATSQRAHAPKRQELLLLLLSMIHDVSLVWARLLECNFMSVVQVGSILVPPLEKQPDKLSGKVEARS